MAYTVQQLISRAWYLSGIVARELQTVSGDQITEGLNLLNALLAIKTANNRLIPYYDYASFTGVIGQETYFIENLISVEELTFNIGTVRYSMLYQDRVTYFGNPRVDNIEALPFSYYVERVKGGANIYVYFTPQGEYTFNYKGKFGLLDNLQLDDDLTLIYDSFYIEYLRYALAEYMCNDYNISFTDTSVEKLRAYEQMITDISPIDLTMQKLSSLQVNTSINYGDVNIGHGWRP